MEKEIIVQLHANFEQLLHKEEESGVEFWLARDLQEILGYQTWRSFEQVIQKAITACQQAGYASRDHFAEIGKMVPLGKGGEREISDFMLTRYACYLIAQNGDSSKEPIAFAQTYFAIQTRKQELIEQRLAEVERLEAPREPQHRARAISTCRRYQPEFCLRSPEGTVVISQGRKPLESDENRIFSPERATVNRFSELLSPLRGL